MIKVVVNGKHENDLEFDKTNSAEKVLLLNGEPKKLDVINQGGGSYHVLSENKSFLVDVVKVDYKAKELELRINGNTYSVQLKDENDLLLERLGMSELSKGKIKDLKAPMPGMVLEVLVKSGDIVKEGDPLIILEAMKMENALKASAELTIKKIEVKKNQTVEKGQMLVSFE